MTKANRSPNEPAETLGQPGVSAGSLAGAQAAVGTELVLPRPPGVFRRWLAAHPRAVDGIIVGTYLFGCALMFAFAAIIGFVADDLSSIDAEAATEAENSARILSWPWLLVVIATISITAFALWRRRRSPLLGVAAVALLLFLEQGPMIVPNSVALVFLLYAVPVHRSVVAGWLGFLIAVVLNTAQIALSSVSDLGAVGPGITIAAAESEFAVREILALSTVNALWLLAVLMIGINIGNRKRYVEALIDRAHQLAREREQRAQLAAATERARIAREMHDIVAHSLSVVVTLSEAASVAVDTQPEASKQAMERAAETGRGALVEMRRLLGVLHTGDDRAPEGVAPPLGPQPGLAELHSLADGFREAGLRLTLTESGVPSGDSTQQLTVYRIVQEALTNSLRHAGQGAEVSVILEHGQSETHIEVRDGGPPAGRTLATSIPGSGQGLAGARERARIFGGSLEAGPTGTGWLVNATVPTQQLAPGAEKV